MKHVLLLLFVAIAVLSPPLKLAEGMPHVRAEIAIVLIALISGAFKPLKMDAVSKALFYFSVCVAISIVASYTIFSTPFNGKDFMIFPMLLQYWLIYCFGRSASNGKWRNNTLLVLCMCIAVSAVIAIAQKFNIAGVNSWLTPYYQPNELQVAGLLRGEETLRVVGTIGDPRHLTLILSLGVGAVAASMMNSVNFSKILGVGMIGVYLAAAMLAVSRTGMLAIFTVIVIAVIMHARKTGRIGASILTIVMFGLLLMSAWHFVAPDFAKDRFVTKEAVIESHSMRARKRDTMEPFVKSMKNPMILVTGRGPSKSVLPGSEHSEIGWVVLRFGLVALFVYISMLRNTVKRGIRIYNKGKDVRDINIGMFGVMMIATWVIFWISESVFKLDQVMSVCMFFIGIVFSVQGRRPKRKRVRHIKQHKSRPNLASPSPAPL